MRRVTNELTATIGGRVAATALLILSFIAASSSDALASHFRYATIDYKPILAANGTPTGRVEFHIKQAWRRSFFGNNVQINQQFNTETFFFGDNTSATVRIRVTSMSVQEDWIIGEATLTHQYAGPGPYVARGSSNARIANLNNGSNAAWYYDTLVHPFSTNSSPTSALPPIVTVPRSTASQFFVPASDVDRDTLRFRITQGSGAGAGTSPAPGLSINANTGLVTWNNNSLDAVNFWFTQIIIEDLDSAGNVKSRIPVDVLLKIVNASSQPPRALINGSTSPLSLSVAPGSPVTFTFTGDDPDGPVPVTLSASGLPAAAAMTPALPVTSSSPVSSVFSWTPTVSDGGSRTISFVSTDNTGLIGLNSVSIFVETNQPPTIACSAPVSVQYGTAAALSVTVADTNGDALTVNWDVNNDGIPDTVQQVPATTASTSLNLSHNFGAVGDYTVAVAVVDAKNASASCNTTVKVLKADQSISFDFLPDVSYGVGPVPLIASATSGLPVAFQLVSGPATLSGNVLSITGAGVVHVRAVQPGDASYNPAPDVDQSFTVEKANATITVAGFTGVYDGQPHGATGTAKGISGEVLAGLDLGDTFTDVPGGTATWVFTDTTGNYNNASGTVPIVINKANATIQVHGYTGVYDAQAHGATGIAKGIGGVPLAGLDLGGSFTNVPGGLANWVFTDTTGNYNDANGSVEIVITKATATINVQGYTGVYDAQAHGATGTATGVGGVLLAGLNLGGSFTNVPGGVANWVFTDPTGNYHDANGSVPIVITKANATIDVQGYTGVYDGQAHGATGTAKGIGGAVLSGLNLGSTFTNVPGGTAAWIFTDTTGNYHDAKGSVEIVINKANATIAVSGYTGLYDAQPHGASGTAQGVDGETLSGLNLGPTFVDVPGGTATWVFTDTTGNYNDASGSVLVTITPSPLTIRANDKVKIQGGANPALDGQIVGLNYDGVSGVFLTQVVEMTLPGSYPIVVQPTASNPAKLANYDMTLVPGTFTVLPNQAPVIQGISANLDPVQVTAAATVHATFTDADIPESGPYVASINWGDGITTTMSGTELVTVTAPVVGGAAGTISGSHKYATPGVYTITVTVSDKIPGTDTAQYQYVVVYDPDGGFVTGGGFINSPEGAYAAEPTLSGRASFGFVAKYIRGVTSGQTEFQFKAGGLNFHSSAYEWLTVASFKAIYKGSGTINRQGDYGFLLSAIDGQINGGGGIDRFRIKIWEKATGYVVYDNQVEGADVADNADPVTALAGGSISIKSK